MQRRELDDLTFTCIDGCGFCCTFPPAVTRKEERRLQAQYPDLRVVGPKADRRLGLQGCGACVLLSRRACSAYDLRPRHCRYFPFHVYFGEDTEILVNRTCRGVEARAGARLVDAFATQVKAVADPAAWPAHEDLARRTYAAFWAHVAGARPGLADPPRFEVAWQDALVPFAARSVVERPFYLAPDLQWLTFEPAGDGLDILAMEEDGTLTDAGHVRLPPPHAPPVAGLVAWLTGRGPFAGQVHHLVDEADYEVSIEDAAAIRRTRITADLAVRWSILQALGTPHDALAEETRRFYDTTFLDAPTVGGWL